LEPFALEAAAASLNQYDMVILGEFVWAEETWLQRLFAADKQQMHRNWHESADPRSGVLLPRVFRGSVLRQALAAIPSAAFNHVVTEDHAIIYLEASKITRRVDYVPRAVAHNEPRALRQLIRKQFRWGIHQADVAGGSDLSEYRAAWLS